MARRNCIYNIIFNRKKTDLTGGAKALLQVEVRFPDGTKKYLGTGYYITADQWNKRAQLVMNTDIDAKINKSLSDFVNQLKSIEISQLETGMPFNRHNLDLLLNASKNDGSFTNFANNAINDRIDISISTKRNYLASIANLESAGFTKFSSFTVNGIERLDKELRKSGKDQTTIHKIHKHVRMLLGLAINHGLFSESKNPYRSVKIPLGKASIRPRLDDNEMSTIEQYIPRDVVMELTRDLFVFAMYTGLSYVDVCSLETSNLRFVENQWWIEGIRGKSGEYYGLPVLPPAQSILNKYNSGIPGKVFPAPSLQEQNRRLKTLSSLIGINKKLTTHVARHTCATFLLRKGVSLKTVSQILGHTKVTTTEIYAKLEKERVKEEFDALRSRLKQIDPHPGLLF